MVYAKSAEANNLCSRTMLKATSVLGIGFISIIFVGFLGIYHTSHPARKLNTAADYHQNIIELLISNVRGNKIAENLRHLTTLPHPAGTRANSKVADKISEIWKANGLQNVHYVNYDVLLSYPDYDNPNHLHILDRNGQVRYTTKGISPPLIPEEQSAEGAGVQWLAYSGNGSVEEDVVYCHFGRTEDFMRLKRLGVDPAGKIAMIRYGKVFRGDKVRNAQLEGAIGVILFSDPAEVARDGTQQERVYPNTEWMPNEGVQRGSIMHGNGDPLSPLYPSKKNLYRSRTISEAKAQHILPNIPVLPLSYKDAYEVLSYMGGALAPYDWQGGLNLSYHLGPNMKQNHKIRITVHSSLLTRTVRNVVGYIHGVTDPDRYVILGNHYDAWVYGSLDPNSGTAILAEIARAFVQTMKETNWKPARTVMFCNWDAEEFGLIGSTEFVEEYANLLNQRAVAYLNVDNIHSNKSLHVCTVPTFYQIVSEVSKQIANPMKSERSRGRKTLYDTWIRTFPSDLEFRPDAPSMPIPGAGSDHAPFLTYLGIPVADITYRNATDYDNYPLYHSLYETPFTNEHIFDTDNLAVHEAVGSYWAALAYKFADSAILPMNVSDLALSLLRIYIPPIKDALDKLRDYWDILHDSRQQLNHLIKASLEFLEYARKFEKIIWNALRVYTLSPYDLKNISLLNDRLMEVERCFINPRGMPGRPSQRHLLFSVDNNDEYFPRILGSVYDAINGFKESRSEAERIATARLLAAEISVIQSAVECATGMLKESI